MHVGPREGLGGRGKIRLDGRVAEAERVAYGDASLQPPDGGAGGDLAKLGVAGPAGVVKMNVDPRVVPFGQVKDDV